jgi:hypothetical protein
MRRNLLLLLLFTGGLLLYSCKERNERPTTQSVAIQNKILQQEDGTISLKVDKADLYQDEVNPSTNTAEWNVFVSKSGRFNVWLSSATKDTTSLDYQNSILLSILDNRIEVLPEVDKVIHNSSDVSYPYFRADSFLGSLYIQDTGLYNVQIISEKIIPNKDIRKEAGNAEKSKLLSVFLTPITQ